MVKQWGSTSKSAAKAVNLKGRMSCWGAGGGGGLQECAHVQVGTDYTVVSSFSFSSTIFSIFFV